MVKQSTSTQEVERIIKRKREIRKINVFKTFKYAQKLVSKENLNNSVEKNNKMVSYLQ